MTESEASALTAKLVAAFPHPRVEPLTVQVYAEAIGRLKHYDAALEVVNDLIATARMLPRVADVVEGYDRIRDRFGPKALREPPMSAEQVAYNKARAHEMLERLTGRKIA
jgi:hypothetical protein